MSDQIFYYNESDEPELARVAVNWEAVLNGDSSHLCHLLDNLRSDHASVRIDSAHALTDVLESMTYDELTHTVEAVSYALANESNPEASSAMITLLRCARNARRAWLDV